MILQVPESTTPRIQERFQEFIRIVDPSGLMEVDLEAVFEGGDPKVLPSRFFSYLFSYIFSAVFKKNTLTGC